MNSRRAPASPADIVGQFSSSGLARSADVATATSGVVSVAGVHVLVSSLPITASDSEGPARGSLVMGRALIPATLARLASLADTRFSLYEPGDARLPDGLLDAPTTPPSESTLTSSPGFPLATPGYGVIVDRDGSPAIVISSPEPEASLVGISQGLAVLLGVLLIVGVAWGGATIVFVESFKYRNRIGFDVAIEALQEVVRGRMATPAEIMVFAQIDGVETVVRPYLQALL